MTYEKILYRKKQIEEGENMEDEEFVQNCKLRAIGVNPDLFRMRQRINQGKLNEEDIVLLNRLLDFVEKVVKNNLN